MSPATAELAALGATVQLTAQVLDQNGQVMAGATVTWASSATGVATVSASGLVQGAGEGTATITATSGDVSGTSEITVFDPDRAALVALYNATDGPNWVDNTNWLTDTPLGEWYGVVTDALGRVVELDLSAEQDKRPGDYLSHGLSGAIPPELGNLTHLQHLSLTGNDLSGAVPPELGNLGNLQSLSLAYNALSGPIPPELGNLASLVVLDIRRNRDFVTSTGLSGPIPPELGGLANLEIMNLTANLLSGPIPPELGDLANLEALQLNNNDLSGPIPREFGGLTNLTHLGFYVNDLSGPIPRELGNLANLRRLDLGDNHLSGPVPPELGNLAKLQFLNLAGNELSGPIPPELGDLPILSWLALSNNDFTGALPESFLKLWSLRTFGWYCGESLNSACAPATPSFLHWLGRLAWTGVFCNASDQAVLTNLFNATGGEEWVESVGWLDGPALEEWHGVSSDSLGRVTVLDLSDNGLSGDRLGNIGDLGQLTELRIDGNPLGGRLPLSLTHLDLDEFHYDGTELCEPADDDFRAWLDGIASRRGTGIQCAPFTDREVLAVLYEATDGPNWVNSEDWLTEVPLARWHGVQTDERGQVTGISLIRNGLTGLIPPELGGLAKLESLYLAGNELSGAIPPELGGLPNLGWLDLHGNDLSGAIPPELGDLGDLRSMVLSSNDLSGPIPAELGGLPELEGLDLYNNNLSGPIPPELGNLTNLRGMGLGRNSLSGAIPPELGGLLKLERLDLDANKLSGPIPPRFGNLANLGQLSLQSNALTGSIPPELGSLTNLQSLLLSNNALTGPIPPELGGLGNLLTLRLGSNVSDIGYNQLSGPIPEELGNLTNLRELSLQLNALSGDVPPELGNMTRLESLQLQGNTGLAGPVPLGIRDLPLQTLMAMGTDLCIPWDPPFSTWLATISRHWIARCSESLAYLVQAVQSRAHPVPLVAGEEALLRVFVTAAKETDEGIPAVRARFFLDGAEQHVVDIPAGNRPIPTELDEGDLSKSANAKIPGQIVQPGLEMVVEIDPGGELDPELGVPTRIPETGRMAIEAREMPALDLKLIPFLWAEDPDSVVLEAVDGMARDPEGHGLLHDTRVLLPVNDIRVTAHEPVVSTSNHAHDLGWQTEGIRILEGGEGHYMGMMSGAVTGAAGVAIVGGRASFSIPDSKIMAHELGHNMSLRHAPNCGYPSTHDQWYPYPRGWTGAWGYDFRGERVMSAYRKDVMSYCNPHWISDYHFTNAFLYRLRDDGAPSRVRAAAQTTSLLLWGGVDADGQLFLNPAFVVDAPPALPDLAGDHTITGRDAGGGELFSLSFTMQEWQSKEATGSSFVFALPAWADWADDLASVTLSGPAGHATLDADSDAPMAILRDPRNGRVVAFLHDATDPSAAQATAGNALTQAAGGLDVLFSRGIPDATAWRR